MGIQGKIIKIGETKEFGSNGFRKREMVLETNERYPQKLLIDFIQDNCSILDNFNTDDKVEIEIEIRGREWISPDGATKYFNSFVAKQIKKDGSHSAETKDNNENNNADDDTDLPF